jgi:molybdopterin adenylyltransferase
MDAIHVGIITVSDRASRGEYEDTGGPALRNEAETRGWQVVAEAVIPDDRARIAETIRAFAARGCGLILTTGGTGIAERDVTPEAVRDVMRLEVPGFGELMRMRSVESTPNALVSRCMAALVDSSLVIALPGKPQGAMDCLGYVAEAVEHAVKSAGGLPTSC